MTAPICRTIRRPLIVVVVLAAALAAVVVLAVLHVVRGSPSPQVALPLREAGRIALPGDTSRFDYANLDPGRGLLFIAHLGASEIIEVDVHAGRVVRTISDVADAHGVLVVPGRHRV